VLWIDTHGSISLEHIISMVSSRLHSVPMAPIVQHALSKLRIVKVFTPWELLDALGKINNTTSFTSIVIIDSLFHIIAPYQSLTEKPGSVAPTCRIDSLLAQMAVSLRYLSSELNCLIFVSNTIAPIPKYSQQRRNVQGVCSSAYCEAVDVTLYCKHVIGPSVVVAVELVDAAYVDEVGLTSCQLAL
jgi:hypothetical protein